MAGMWRETGAKARAEDGDEGELDFQGRHERPSTGIGKVLFVNKKNQKTLTVCWVTAGASAIPRYRGIADALAVYQPSDKVFALARPALLLRSRRLARGLFGL